MPKVVLRCESEQELLELEAAAERAGLPNALIRDAGHTVVAAGTVTCLGIGPAQIDAIDALTRELKLAVALKPSAQLCLHERRRSSCRSARCTASR